METNVGFRSIGFTAALILNRLRCDREIREDKAADDGRRQEQERKEQEVRAQLKRVNERLAILKDRGK